MLNNNMIIKEMANKYKGQMESALGGWLDNSIPLY